jgi:hypothetical protein
MNRPLFRFILAILSLFGFSTAAPDCLAWDGVAAYCPSCHWPHNWHLVDCYTRCAWHRTWHGPNALATPLTPYYIPRPPACCWSGGGLFDRGGGCGYNVGAAYGMTNDIACENPNLAITRDVSPEAAAVSSPVQSERLGKVPNELDLVGPAGSAAPSRAAAPAR